MDSLSKKFKEIRKRSGRTMRQVQATCGVSVSTISRFENGHEEISHASVNAMFRALGYGVTFTVITKRAGACGIFCFAEMRPYDAQIIGAMYPDGVWRTASYFSGGIDGIIICRGTQSETEVAEFPNMLWRPWSGDDDTKDN